MLLDRWRARRALLSRSPPSTVEDSGDTGLRAVVDGLSVALGAPNSLGDPIWHHRWEGDLQVVGLDAANRSVSDVRQRLARTVHELALRHMASRGRRMLAVVRCSPEDGEGLKGWHARLWEDQGEVGVADWKAARSNVTVLLLGPDDERQLFGGDRDIKAAVEAAAG